MSLVMVLFISACSSSIDLTNSIGFGLSSKANVDEWSDKLGAQWYFDWSTKASRKSKQIEYWQTIRVNQNGYSPSREKIETIAKKFSGYTWIIGNEPDNAFQDNTSPEKYAEIYHELYMLIKSKDRHAKIAIAGVSQPTPTRLAYLSKVLESYEQMYNEKLPVDWWNIHAYVLREENDSWGAGIPVGLSFEHGELYEIEQHGDISIFQQNLIQFRKWMKENGYQDSPLVVTEFGILLPEDFGYSQKLVSDYLNQTSLWMLTYKDEEIGFPEDDYRLVQKFAWFSLSDPNFPSSNLADLEKNSLTEVGEVFNSLTQNNITKR